MPDLSSFHASVVIALSTVAAFVAGRITGWLIPRRKGVWIVMRAIVLTFVLAVAVFFLFSQASRYALLLPAGFAAGFLSQGRRRMAPSVFQERKDSSSD